MRAEFPPRKRTDVPPFPEEGIHHHAAGDCFLAVNWTIRVCTYTGVGEVKSICMGSKRNGESWICLNETRSIKYFVVGECRLGCFIYDSSLISTTWNTIWNTIWIKKGLGSRVQEFLNFWRFYLDSVAIICRGMNRKNSIYSLLIRWSGYFRRIFVYYQSSEYSISYFLLKSKLDQFVSFHH